MDSTPKTMYDTFKDEIWKELGPLDPDWFQILTTQTSSAEGNLSDPDELCANQEGNFKTPGNKTAPESQLFSTPKVFRRHRAASPETEDEPSFTNEQEKEKLPWAETQSPCLFGRERTPAAKYEGFQPPSEESFDLLHPSPKSPVSCAKRIRESLGAQIHPDISWTSSLNTPPAVSSTLILSKHDESPCPMGISAETNVVFVRKLFPSLSNDAGCSVPSPKNEEMPLHKDVCPEADQNPASDDSLQDSQNASVWKQKVPDAIEDGAVRSTVASILDGAETALSVFFSNSSSSLRKVKMERVRRKQMFPLKEHAYSLNISPTNTAASSSEQRTEDCGPVKLSTPPPPGAKEPGITQWSPLALSDIPPSTLDSHHSVSATQVDKGNTQLQSGHPVRPLTDTLSRFPKKKRTFVYTIETPKTKAPPSEKLKMDTVHDTSLEMNTSHRPPESGHKVGTELSAKAADGCRIYSDEMQRQTSVQPNPPPPPPPPPAQSKVPDLDMSQLCRDFAQDFSQTLEPGRNSSAVAEDAPQNGFSPSACLSDIKRAKCKDRQANSPHGRDDISDCRSTPAIHQTHSTVNDSTVVDSGFQSAVGEITHFTSLNVPCTENMSPGQQSIGLKIESQTAASPLYNTRNVKQHSNSILEEAGTSAAVEQSQTLHPSREIEAQVETTSAQLPGFPSACEEKEGFPEKAPVFPPFVNGSGFKTASNKTIEISSAHLEKAKRLLDESEAGWTCNDRLPARAENGKDKVVTGERAVEKTNPDWKQPNETLVNRLTASQKADVSELCTLLEGADSQFEFSECKPAGDEVTPQQKDDKDLDPDFLMGIDFDDSFDAENHKKAGASDDISKCEASKVMNKSSTTKESSTIEDVYPLSKNASVGRRCSVSAENPNHGTVGDNERGKLENETPLMSGVGFKTARGNILQISKEFMRKAQALFGDIEESLTSAGERSRDDAAKSDLKGAASATNVGSFQPSKMGTSTFQRGFQTASGKGVSVSAKALQEAGALFKDCDISQNNTFISSKHQDTKASPSFVGKKSSPKFKGIERDNEKQPSTSEFKKGTEIDALKETNQPQRSESDASRRAGPTNQIQAESMKTSGFQTASGKGVSVSAKALQEAGALFKDCDISQNNTFISSKHQETKASPSFVGKKSSPKFKGIERDNENQPSTSEFKKGTEIDAPKETNQPQRSESDALRRAGPTNQIQAESMKTSGFQTASGKGVSVSAKALQEAGALFKDCDISQNNTFMSLKHQKDTEASPSFVGKKSSQKCKGIQGGNENQPSTSEFKKGPEIDAPEETNQPQRWERDQTHQIQAESMKNIGFQTASGKGVVFSSAALNKAKLLFSECETVEGEIVAAPKLPLQPPASRPGRFLAAGGKPVALSAEALQKAKALFKDIDVSSALPSASDTPKNDVLQSTAGNSDKISCGFKTAAGASVCVSRKSLLKTKHTLKDDEEEAEVKDSEKLLNTKLPVSFSSHGNAGFHSASGKPVAFSSEALQRARSLFTDMDVDAETDSDARKIPECTEAQNNAGGGKISCGFTTAGGAKVHVLQKNLLKAKSLLKECTDGETHHSTTSTHVTDLLSMKNLNKTSVNAANHKDPAPVESVPPPTEPLPTSVTDRGNDNRQNRFSFGEKVLSTVVTEGTTTPAHEVKLTHGGGGGEDESDRNHKNPEDSSFLIFQPLDLGDCSETQQMLLAQEALDCTKALLEYESLTKIQNLSGTLEKEPKLKNLESVGTSAEVRKGKRLGDDADLTSQPPLKRRLLEEFDRSVDGPRGSALLPQKCCQNSTFNDRRAFNFDVFPHPNVTKPHWTGNQYMETTVQNNTPTKHPSFIGGRSTKTFVPPFIKNVKTETSRNAVVNVNRRAHPVFVPPFKKQRTIVEDGSCKAQQQEDKHHHHPVTPSHSSSHAPTSKQTPSAINGAGNNGKADTRAEALTDATRDYPANNHRVPVGCRSEVVRATCGESLFSRDISPNVEAVELAQDMQDMRRGKKKRQTIRPLPGSLFLTKNSGLARIPLRSAVDGKSPAKYSPKQLYGYGVLQHVCDITGETAETFRFNLQQFLSVEAFKDAGGVQLADGGWLIPRNDWTAGKEEFYRALCDTRGVDPKLISEEWAHNHYKWIVWKQASMERAFPATMGGVCLTPEQVLLKLKYRYDVEIDHSRRPALRKIMEKDDTSAKTLVLCVSGVVSQGHRPNCRSDAKTPQKAKAEPPTAVVWLTDGWYAIKAQLDEPLTAMLHKRRLATGGKLIISGAQLVGSQDACSPLEAPDSLMLKLCANSTRPARWDTKLGFHRDPRPFLLPLSCLYGNGGPVGCVDITILRSYPMQWMERKPDGAVVFRSVRAEEKEERRHSSQSQRAMEILFAKIQAEFELEQKGNNKAQRRRRTINRQDIANLHDGEELHEAAENDSQYLEAHLSERQLETLQTYRRSLMEKKQAELQDRYRRALEAENSSCPKRDVAPVWRLCIADSREQSHCVYQLSLWRPSSDLQSILKEGCRYKVYNLSASEGKRRSGIEGLQLTGTKKTQFQDLQASKEWLSTYFQPRVSTHFATLQNPDFQPLCGEVDLTGFIISIIDGQGPSPSFYLADGEMSFVKVCCLGSFAQSGLEDVVKPRVLLALSNLQLRGQSSGPTPVANAGDLTVCSTNPKELHLQESLSRVRNLVQGQENYFLKAEEKLSRLLESDHPGSFSSPAQHPPTPAASTDITTHQAARSLGPCTPVGKIPPAPTPGSDKDPRGLKRRRALDYLSRIPSPPALSHLGSAASPCLKKTFNPPRRSGTPSTLKSVQTPVRKPVSTAEDEWVNDEELAMIDTQNLHLE